MVWFISSKPSKRRTTAVPSYKTVQQHASNNTTTTTAAVVVAKGKQLVRRSFGWVRSSVVVIGTVVILVVVVVVAVTVYHCNESCGGGSSSRLDSARHHRTSRRRRRGPPDATFNGGPVYLTRRTLSSSLAATTTTTTTRVHCVGETYQLQTAWKSRSCRFDGLFCFNVTARDFVVWQQDDSTVARELDDLLQQRPYHHVSSSLHRHNESNAVSLGGINQKWGKSGIPRLKWFPQIQTHWSDQGNNDELVYYALPETAVLVPFHSMNGANPGHLVWDDFLPIYTLLTMFGLVSNENSDNDDDLDLIPLRFVLHNNADDNERGLWASCDLRPEKAEACRHMMTKFWPLIAGHDNPYQFSSTKDARLEPTSSRRLESDLVCASTGLAGLGPLTDHGLYKAHGWEETDYRFVHNAGRGGALRDFRRFLLRNVGLSAAAAATAPSSRPFRIVFSQKSSDIFIRSMDFKEQIALVERSFPHVIVEHYIFKNMTLMEQLQVATRASIYITLCGGGAVTAMFLPPGASVIVYYAQDGGVSNGKMTHKPALLDWDLLNAMSYVRVHWISRNTRKTALDDTILVKLIQHELDIMTASAAEADAVDETVQ
jgi:hypothetical protein